MYMFMAIQVTMKGGAVHHVEKGLQGALVGDGSFVRESSVLTHS